MSLREFIASLWRFYRKPHDPPGEEWLGIAQRLKALQEPVGAPSHHPSPEGDSGQHSPCSDSKTVNHNLMAMLP